MAREQKYGDDMPDGEQLIARMDAIRSSSERHVVRMHAEAERLVDWREHVRSQPLLAVAVASAAGFLLMYRKATPAKDPPRQSAARQEEVGEAARATFASGAMAFAGTMIGNLVKQSVSNYVKNKLAGVQHDRRENEQPKPTDEFATRSPDRW